MALKVKTHTHFPVLVFLVGIGAMLQCINSPSKSLNVPFYMPLCTAVLSIHESLKHKYKTAKNQDTKLLISDLVSGIRATSFELNAKMLIFSRYNIYHSPF